MKKYAGVLKKVRQTQMRRNEYETTDGNSYKRMKIFYILGFVWTMAVNTLYILGMFLELIGSDSYDSGAWLDVVIIFSFPIAYIVATILCLKFKKYLISGIVSVVPIIFGIITVMIKSDILTGKEPINNMARENFKGLVIVSLATILIIAGLVLIRYKQHLISGIISFIPEVCLIYLFTGFFKDNLEGLFGLRYDYYLRHGIPLAIMLISIVGMTVIAVKGEVKLNREYKKVVESLYSDFIAQEGDAENVSEEKWTEYLKNYDPYKNNKNKAVKEKIFKDK